MGTVDRKRNLPTTNHQSELWCIAFGQNKDEALLQELLESNHVTPDERAERYNPGRTLLSIAASRASAAIVRIFLASGKVNPNSRDTKGRTPLSYAAEEKRVAVVRTLLETNKVDPDSRDDAGRTPLSYAVGGKHDAIAADREAVVTMLIGSDRVKPDSQDNKGRTPLSYAVDVKSDTIVGKLLSSNRVDPDSRDANGRTPLSYAASEGRDTIARMLLDSGKVDPDSRDKNGRNPLSWAARNRPASQIFSRWVIRNTTPDVTIPLYLLETGKVNPASQDDEGYTALWWAIGDGWEELVELLLGTGRIDVEAKEKSTGRTLLSHAARVGNEPIVKKLLSTSNVDLNSKDNQGITPLMWAMEYGNTKVVNLLLGDDRLHQDLEEHNGLEIDARYLTHWARSCSQQHGKSCVPSPVEDRLPHQIPDWVIDTAEGCLVSGHTVSRYIALSYVWVATDTSTDVPTLEATQRRRANHTSRIPYDSYARRYSTKERSIASPRTSDVPTTERLMLTQKNLAQFQERGYLQGDLLVRLPQTVKEAIVLVQKYEERYLWVDCLCIVQDSERTRDQVDNMGEIYAGAYLTIVAATASGRLNTRKSLRDTENSSLDSTTSWLYNKLFKTKWATRGWTFQEQMLSKRVMIFLDGDVFWDCQECVWNRENLTPEFAPITSFIRPHYDTARRISTMSRPDLNTYIEMVSLYNNRDLTYPQDALPAISGVLNTLKRSFISGFVSGLPCDFLDIALSWQPYSIADRRVVKDGGSIAPGRHLPSWSWCGWRCPVDPHYLRSRFENFEEHTTDPSPLTWQTHSIVQWYALSEDMQHAFRIDGSDPLSTRKEAALDEAAIHGGTHISSHQSECASSRGDKHAGSEDATTTSNSHRLLVSPNHDPRSARQLRQDWPFLLCRTSAASLCIKSVLKGGTHPHASHAKMAPSVFKLDQFARVPSYSEMCYLICLKDKEGNQAGVLRHMSRDRAEPGDGIELIALSTGTIRLKHLRNVGEYNGPLFRQHMGPVTQKSNLYHRLYEDRSSNIEDWSSESTGK